MVTGIYADTLLLLESKTTGNGFVVANRDAAEFGCDPTALSNRLAWLETNGLATSIRYGRQRRFRAIQTESPKEPE